MAFQEAGRAGRRARFNGKISRSVNGRSAIGLADDIGDTFGTHFGRMLAPRRYLAVIAGMERLGFVVAGYRDLATQNHDPGVEVVRMRLLREPGRLTAMHYLETLTTQVTVERFAGEGASVAASARQGDAFWTDMFGMHAPRRHFEALSGVESGRRARLSMAETKA